MSVPLLHPESCAVPSGLECGIRHFFFLTLISSNYCSFKSMRLRYQVAHILFHLLQACLLFHFHIYHHLTHICFTIIADKFDKTANYAVWQVGFYCCPSTRPSQVSWVRIVFLYHLSFPVSSFAQFSKHSVAAYHNDWLQLIFNTLFLDVVVHSDQQCIHFFHLYCHVFALLSSSAFVF